MVSFGVRTCVADQSKQYSGHMSKSVKSRNVLTVTVTLLCCLTATRACTCCFRMSSGACSPGYWSGPCSGCTICSAGTYGVTGADTTSACTGPCSAGYYCPAGSSSPTQTSCPSGLPPFCLCDRLLRNSGNYCPAGCATPTGLCQIVTRSPHCACSVLVGNGQLRHVLKLVCLYFLQQRKSSDFALFVRRWLRLGSIRVQQRVLQ